MNNSPFSSKPYDDLLKRGASATELDTHGEAEGWERLFSNRKLKTLRIAYLKQEQAARLNELKSLETLHVFNGLVNDLFSLGELSRLRQLKLEVTGHIKDFSFFGRLKNLRTLKLVDVARFKDVSVLAKLPSLHTFEFSRMAPLPDLVSFEKLKQVRVLHAAFDVKDGSLSPLMNLVNLKELRLPLAFELKEYARLAVSLPRVKCACFTRPYGLSESSFSKCKRCGGLATITLTKGYRGLCPECDDAKFQSYLRTFEELKAEFRRKLKKSRVTANHANHANW